jgi:hypothetical protein
MSDGADLRKGVGRISDYTNVDGRSIQTSNELGSSVGVEHAQLVKTGGGNFIPINITCTLDENVKRLTSTDRLAKNKLINIEILSEIRVCSYILKFNVPYELLKLTLRGRP